MLINILANYVWPVKNWNPLTHSSDDNIHVFAFTVAYNMIRYVHDDDDDDKLLVPVSSSLPSSRVLTSPLVRFESNAHEVPLGLYVLCQIYNVLAYSD